MCMGFDASVKKMGRLLYSRVSWSLKGHWSPEVSGNAAPHLLFKDGAVELKDRGLEAHGSQSSGKMSQECHQRVSSEGHLGGRRKLGKNLEMVTRPPGLSVRALVVDRLGEEAEELACD